ncbi:unnamed protein product [Cyprideis torosa]|uniref:Uncharacterized protein n=1 Tax=Cyprideis torosa TaxID=163714 RepID=A0A7R8W9K2_9CRUS|nr:unnamed protein product [Cyprideis torosa]CAG0889883.1 unnamed protein product [Cyprideis torosa]
MVPDPCTLSFPEGVCPVTVGVSAGADTRASHVNPNHHFREGISSVDDSDDERHSNVGELGCVRPLLRTNANPSPYQKRFRRTGFTNVTARDAGVEKSERTVALESTARESEDASDGGGGKKSCSSSDEVDDGLEASDDDRPLSCKVVFPHVKRTLLTELLEMTKGGRSLTDKEVEEHYTSLALAFKTDRQTLEDRLDVHARKRDLAEDSMEKELDGDLLPLCPDSETIEMVAQIQKQLDVVQRSTGRLSSAAEIYGQVQQEARISCAVDVMIRHVENCRRLYDREKHDLDEARLVQLPRILAEHKISFEREDAAHQSSSVMPKLRAISLAGQSHAMRLEAMRQRAAGGKARSTSVTVAAEQNVPWSLPTVVSNAVVSQLNGNSRILIPSASHGGGGSSVDSGGAEGHRKELKDDGDHGADRRLVSGKEDADSPKLCRRITGLSVEVIKEVNEREQHDEKPSVYGSNKLLPQLQEEEGLGSSEEDLYEKRDLYDNTVLSRAELASGPESHQGSEDQQPSHQVKDDPQRTLSCDTRPKVSSWNYISSMIVHLIKTIGQWPWNFDDTVQGLRYATLYNDPLGTL